MTNIHIPCTLQWLSIGRSLSRLIKAVMKIIQSDSEASSPKKPPTPKESRLKQVTHPATMSLCWSCEISKALCLGYGNWGKSGKQRILVANHKKQLHVLDVGGNITNRLPLPHRFSQIECGWHKDKGGILLGVSSSFSKLYVMDCSGKVLWRYSKWLGINGAHWGDVNEDGNEEVVLGMNAWGGLVALTSEGKLLWKMTNIRNVWNHTLVPQISDRRALILATEASGTINVYNDTGKLLQTLRPEGLYFGAVAASVVQPPDMVQIAAIGGQEGTYTVLACDLSGNVMWKTSTCVPEDVWMRQAFASGDMNGDGVREWAFMENPGELVFVSPQGEKLATLSVPEVLEQFLIAPQSDGYGILVTLQAGVIKAYQLDKS